MVRNKLYCNMVLVVDKKNGTQQWVLLQVTDLGMVDNLDSVPHYRPEFLALLEAIECFKLKFIAH